MSPKIKIVAKVSIIIFIIALTVFVTKRSESWFRPTTKIDVVFNDSVFSGIPELRPLRDVTRYTFDKCDFTGRQYGEQITPAEVDEAIAKLDKMEAKK